MRMRRAGEGLTFPETGGGRRRKPEQKGERTGEPRKEGTSGDGDNGAGRVNGHERAYLGRFSWVGGEGSVGLLRGIALRKILASWLCLRFDFFISILIIKK
jgi:hypothetical protein